jgi:hypothetical protein
METSRIIAGCLEAIDVSPHLISQITAPPKEWSIFPLVMKRRQRPAALSGQDGQQKIPDGE